MATVEQTTVYLTLEESKSTGQVRVFSATDYDNLPLSIADNSVDALAGWFDEVARLCADEQDDLDAATAVVALLIPIARGGGRIVVDRVEIP